MKNIVIKVKGQAYTVDLENSEQIRFISILLADAYYSSDPENRKEAGKEAAEGFCRLLEDYIKHLIKKYYPSYTFYFDDLYQNAMLGIMKALNSQEYDPVKSAPTTFFQPYIRHEIYDFIVQQIHNTKPHNAKITRIIKVTTEFLQKHGIEADVKNISFYSGIKEEILKAHMNEMSTVSWETIAEECFSGDEAVAPAVTTEDASIDNVLINEILQEIETGPTLSERERASICYYYGLWGESKTVPEIAKWMNCEEKDIRKWLRDGKTKVRKNIIS